MRRRKAALRFGAIKNFVLEKLNTGRFIFIKLLWNHGALPREFNLLKKFSLHFITNNKNLGETHWTHSTTKVKKLCRQQRRQKFYKKFQQKDFSKWFQLVRIFLLWYQINPKNKKIHKSSNHFFKKICVFKIWENYSFL